LSREILGWAVIGQSSHPDSVAQYVGQIQ
jgi:hypothetical protein